MIRGPFRFDRDAHIYTVGRYQVPGSTEVLRAGGFIQSARFTQAGRTRGTLVHELIEAILLETVDVAALDGAAVSAYVQAAVAFLDETRPRVQGVEACAVNRRLGFATTIDLVGRLRGALGGPMVLNWKTGQPQRSDAIQSAFEVWALDGRVSARRRFTCYLKPTQRYRLEEHTNRGDFDEAAEALTLWRQHEWTATRHAPLRLLDPVETSRSGGRPRRRSRR